RGLAQRVVNRMVAEFSSYSGRTDETEDTTAVVRLRFQVDSTLRRLREAEQALRVFGEQQRLVVPEEQATQQIKRIAFLSGKVDQISTERNALAKMLDVIRARANGGADPTAYRQIATFPTLIT